MGLHKADIEFGHRAYSEAKRIFRSWAEMQQRTGIRRSSVMFWRDGGAPSAKMLAALHYQGADVMYILTGRKSNIKITPEP